MRKVWTTQNLNECLSVCVQLNAEASRIQINSSDVELGDIFIAMKGEKTDGHLYVLDAIKNGATFCIVNRVPENFGANDIAKLIIVPDTYEALKKLAMYKKGRSKAKFIAVTGSVGKTSTKEIIHTALPNSFCSRGNFNTLMGLYVNLASMPDDISYAVFELGMSQANEIRTLSNILNPQICIITTIAPTHIEFFESIQKIADAKSEIFEGMKGDGVAILPQDNEYYEILESNAKNNNISKILTFGKKEHTDCRLISYQLRNDDSNNTEFGCIDFIMKDQKIHVETFLTGEHQAINIGAAILCVATVGANLEEAITRISKMIPKDGRGAVSEILAFGKRLRVIDDAYNSSPASLKASLNNIKTMRDSKKILFLADMLELGENAIKYHEGMLEDVLATKPVKVVVIGKLMSSLGKRLISSGYKNVVFCDDYLMLKSKISDILQDVCLCLFKGSKSTKLYEIVQYIKSSGT